MVNWLWGYTTVGINVDKVKAALGGMPMPDNAWDLVFKPEYISKLKGCGVSFLDSATEVIPAALHYLGKPALPQQEPGRLRRRRPLLKSVRPYVTLFSSRATSTTWPTARSAWRWAGRATSTSRASAPSARPARTSEALIPKTGGILFFDTMVIPADAPHPNNAHKFIDYILRPRCMRA